MEKTEGERVLILQKNNQNYFENFYKDLVKLLLNIKMKTPVELEYAFLKEINRLNDDNQNLCKVSPNFKLLNVGGYASIFSYNGNYILRITNNNIDFNKLGPEKIAYQLLMNSPVKKAENKFIQVAEMMGYNDYLYTFIHKYCNLYKLLILKIYKYKFDKNNKDFNSCLEQLFLTGSQKIMIYLESVLLGNNIINLSVNPKPESIQRFIHFYSTDKYKSQVLVEIFDRAMGDASALYEITHKYIKDFILQILIVLYMINLNKKFLHGDLKINNILIKKCKPFVLPKFKGVLCNFFFKNKYVFLINDFDLSKLENFNCDINEEFKCTWLFDITFLINTLLNLLKSCNKTIETNFLKFLNTEILEKNTYEKGKIITMQKGADSLSNLLRCIHHPIFNDFRQ